MSRPILRHYCGKGQFPDKAAFIFGTVQAESEMQAISNLNEAWAETFPIDPPSWVVLPGLLAFRECE